MGGINYKLKDKNTIIGEYNKCYCSMVKQTKKPFPTKTYCHCGVGHIKQLFESAFGKPVEVKLLESVITGGNSCKFLIRI
jgi:predicted hydrocarbon binding protein